MEILSAVTQIIEKRREEKLSPYTADVIETRILSGLEDKEFNKQARALLDEKKIKLIRTINGFTIDIV